MAIGETFPELRAGICVLDVAGVLEVEHGEIVFAHVVEADAAAEIGLGQIGIQIDRFGERGDGVAVTAQQTQGNAAAELGRGADLGVGGRISRQLEQLVAFGKRLLVEFRLRFLRRQLSWPLRAGTPALVR